MGVRLALAVAALVASVTRIGMAAEPSAADKETSRDLYAEGMAALDAHDYAHAERACSGAYKLVNAPTGALCWGHALEGLGKYVEARDAYLAAAHYPPKPDEPPIFTSARSDGQTAANTVEKRIATLVFAVAGVSESTPIRVAVDGAEIVSDTARLPRKVNPGPHVVYVASKGYRTARVDVTAEEGKELRVAVLLQPEKADASAKQEAPARSSGPSPFAFVALGVGVAGLAVGSVFGAVALAQGKTLSPKCPAMACPPSEQGPVDALRSNEVWSDVGLGVGIVGVGVGAALLLFGHTTEAAPTAIQINVSPRSVALAGRF